MFQLELESLLSCIKRRFVIVALVALVLGVGLGYLTTNRGAAEQSYVAEGVIFVETPAPASAAEALNSSETTFYSAARSFVQEESFAAKVAEKIDAKPGSISVNSPYIKDSDSLTINSPYIKVRVTAPSAQAAYDAANAGLELATTQFIDVMHARSAQVSTAPVMPEEIKAPVTKIINPKKTIVWVVLIFVIVGIGFIVYEQISRRMYVVSDVRNKLGVEPLVIARKRDLRQAPALALIAEQIAQCAKAFDPAGTTLGVAPLTPADLSTEACEELVREVRERLRANNPKLVQDAVRAVKPLSNKLEALESLRGSGVVFAVVAAGAAKHADIRQADETLAVYQHPVEIVFLEQKA